MKHIYIVTFVFIILAMGACHPVSVRQEPISIVKDTIDMPQIKVRDTLIALTAYNSSSYFIYKGQAMGFEYELLKKFSEKLNLNLRIVVERDMDSILLHLNNYEADLVAYALTITNYRRKQVDFTAPLHYTEQVLVQRKPENWRQQTIDKTNKQLVRNVVDLIGKRIYVKRNSPYYARLINLSNELGDTILLEIVTEDLTTEEVISKVANGEIDYTVADKSIAILATSTYDNLDIATPVSFPQRLAWAVRKSSPELLIELNQWLSQIKSSDYYNVLYNKYYRNKTRHRYISKSDFFSHSGSAISPYDTEIKNAAKKIHWDWRLLASQAYQESKFDPWAESWMGAVGIMQIMPETADMYGDFDLWEPDQNIEAATQHMKWLYDIFENQLDSAEHIKFTLASYNVGPGHIGDARRLASKYGKDPNVWDDNVAEMLKLKSEKKYYTDEVVKHGYCRGEETFKYVTQIMNRYNDYKHFFSE